MLQVCSLCNVRTRGLEDVSAGGGLSGTNTLASYVGDLGEWRKCQQKLPGCEWIWIRVDLDTSGSGYGWIWIQVDLDTSGSGYGYKWIWIRVDLDTSGSGYKWIWMRVDLGGNEQI